MEMNRKDKCVICILVIIMCFGFLWGLRSTETIVAKGTIYTHDEDRQYVYIGLYSNDLEYWKYWGEHELPSDYRNQYKDGTHVICEIKVTTYRSWQDQYRIYKFKSITPIAT